MRGKYLLYGTLAAGLTFFVWQTISNVAIPWHTATMSEFQNPSAAVQAIRAAAPTNGVYFANQGVIAAVAFTPSMADKTQISMVPNMSKQLALDLVAALVLCFVVASMGARRKRETVTLVAMAGFAAVMIKELSDWNWYGFSASYALVNIVDQTIGFALAGLVIAAIYKKVGGVTVPAETPGVRAQGSYRAPNDSRVPMR
jgi:hypothetical protein